MQGAEHGPDCRLENLPESSPPGCRALPPAQVHQARLWRPSGKDPSFYAVRTASCHRCKTILVLLTCLLLVLAGIVTAQETSSAEAHANHATELVQAGKLKEAEAELRTAVRLAPGDAAYLGSLGTVLAMQSNFEESTRIFQQALKIRPNDPTVRRYLAANLWQLHRYPEARQNLEILLKQIPDDQPARLLLGMVAENMKDYGKAAEVLASVPDQVRQQPQAIAALARSYYHLGQTREAQSTLGQLEHFSGSTDAMVLGAMIAFENLRARFNRALHIEADGFCDLPADHPVRKAVAPWQSS